MLRMKLSFDNKQLKELERRLKKLQRASATVGWFAQSGAHPTADMSYVDLAKLHASGVPSKNIPVRDPLYLAYKKFNIKNSVLKKDLALYLSGLNRAPKISHKKVLTNWAEEFGNSVKDIFGDESQLEPNAEYTQKIKLAEGKDPRAPLVFDGHLRDAITFRIDNAYSKIS